MAKPISTRMHGVLDYLTAGTLLALPRLLGWKGPVAQVLTGAAVGTLAYSALTRYELAPVKILPMKAHLALDGMSGLLFAAAPLLFPDEDDTTKGILAGIGLFEIAASLLTRTRPADELRLVDVAELTKDLRYTPIGGKQGDGA
jgi:hypothetical protein